MWVIHPWHDVTPGDKLPREFNSIIEIPFGSSVKYELDKESGALFVNRFLHTAMYYPANYGFVPHTLSDDGDPIDVLVANSRPIAPGAVINVRPIGVLKMDPFGVLLAFGRMASDSEIVALRACGIGSGAVYGPALAAGGVLSVGVFLQPHRRFGVSFGALQTNRTVCHRQRLHWLALRGTHCAPVEGSIPRWS